MIGNVAKLIEPYRCPGRGLCELRGSINLNARVVGRGVGGSQVNGPVVGGSGDSDRFVSNGALIGLQF